MPRSTRRSLLMTAATLGGIALLGGGLTACARQAKLEAMASLVDGRGATLEAGRTVHIAPPVLLSELPGAIERDPFHDNALVGNIWFSGGYEILEEEGHQARSVSYSIDRTEEYTQQVTEWLDVELRGVASEQGLTVATLEQVVEPPAPIRRKERGSNELSGKDNRNLPVWSYEPRALSADELEGLSGKAVLVPVVVHYYTHNGGWFVGQELGTAAGTRMRILWTVYDGDSGAVMAWGDAGARRIIPYHYTPSVVELEDLQLAVEGDVRKVLGHQLSGTELDKKLNL